MTRGAAGASITPERYAPYEERFDAYARALGLCCCPYSVVAGGLRHAPPDLAARAAAALHGNNSRGALFLRDAPDRIIISPRTGACRLVEVKAWTSPNLALNAHQLLSNYQRVKEEGIPVSYVAVPPVGPFVSCDVQTLVEGTHKRWIQAAREWPTNHACIHLWQKWVPQWGYNDDKVPKVGQSDAYILIDSEELATWRVLMESRHVAPVCARGR